MPQKTFGVYFVRPSVGQNGESLAPYLQRAFDAFGTHLPARVVENERFQFRSLVKTGSVWSGIFCKLRDDTPNYVDHLNEERELTLADGAAIIEKCHFLYREQSNILVWQVSKAAGTASKAAAYAGQTLNAVIVFPYVQNNAQLEEMLNQTLYEIDFAYAQPAALPRGVSAWSQRAFDILGGLDASYAHFTLRASRGRRLGEHAKAAVRVMMNEPNYKRVKIRLSEDTDPVKLFTAPLKEEFTIEVVGRYPRPEQIFQGLEDAYGRQEHNIRANVR